MTYCSKRDRDRLPSTGRGVKLAAALAATTLLVGAVGCDTVAQIPFSDRNFQSIYPVGMSPSQGQCGGVSGEATMSVVLVDNQGEPVKHEEEVALDFVDPDRDDISFENSTLYAMPDVACESDGDCPDGFICESIDSQDSPGDRCQRTTTVSTASDPMFVDENEPESQAFVVAMSDIGHWRGELRREFADYHPYDRDENEAGEALPRIPVSELEFDGDSRRMHALTTLGGQWSDLNEYVGNEDRDAFFGLWSFAESRAEVHSRVSDVHSGESDWTSSPETATDAISEYRNFNYSPGRSNVYESLSQVLDRAFNDSAMSEVDKGTLVAVVPGHDEERNADADDVIDQVQSISSEIGIDIDVSIVQVDAPRDVNMIPDDWEYYQGQQECAEDHDCENFETCREPTWYTDDPDADSEDDVVYPREADRGKSFCLPDYDDEGRLGPIADYERIACETGGSYHYIPEISQQIIEEAFRGQLLASEATWDFDVVISDDGPGSGEASLLETVMEIEVGRSIDYRFERQASDSDRRRVFFTPE